MLNVFSRTLQQQSVAETKRSSGQVGAERFSFAPDGEYLEAIALSKTELFQSLPSRAGSGGERHFYKA